MARVGAKRKLGQKDTSNLFRSPLQRATEADEINVQSPALKRAGLHGSFRIQRCASLALG